MSSELCEMQLKCHDDFIVVLVVGIHLILWRRVIVVLINVSIQSESKGKKK